MLDKAGCLNHNKEIVNEKLIEAFRNNVIDVAFLNNVLGRQKFNEAV